MSSKNTTNKVNLTATAITRMQPGETLRDSKTSGLQVRCFAGRKSFYLYYRTTEGKERRPKLGDWDKMDIKLARKTANDMLREVAAGHDPSRKRQELRQAPDLEALFDRYMRDHGNQKKTASKDQYLIDKYILPKLGKRALVKDIEHDDISDLHKSMAKTPYQANRILALLSKAFNLAEPWKMRPQNTNPCRHVKRFPERRRRRKMEATEAADVGKKLRHYEAQYPRQALFIWLLVFTGARPGELARTRPQDVQGHKIVLEEHKTAGHTHDVRTVYLPIFVREMIDKLPKIKDGTLLGIKSPRALWEKIRAEVGCPDLQIRDLRRSYASVALAAGYQLDQIGELFDHTNTQTTKGYAWLIEDAAQEAAENIGMAIEQRMLTPAD
jgi:integrase